MYSAVKPTPTARRETAAPEHEHHMHLYFECFRGLLRQWQVSLAYLVGILGLGGIAYYTDAFLGLGTKPEELPSWYGAYASMQDLLQVLGTSALQTACFSIIGHRMDRPAWRCDSMADAFQRFYVPWLMINLIGVVLSRLESRAVGAFGADAFGPFEFLVMVGMLTLPIAGACVMHHGRPAWNTLDQALNPIGRYPSYTLQAMVFPLIAYILRGTILFGPLYVEPPSPLYYTLMVLPFAFLDLAGFAAMWRVCMHYRDHALSDEDPYDF